MQFKNIVSKKIKLLFAFTLVLILSFSCQKEEKQTNRFVTKDVHNFYEMLSQIKNATSLNDSIKILNENYLEKASTGLKNYLKYEKNNNNRNVEKEYLKIIRVFPKYFQSQKPLLSNIENHIKEYDKHFQKIKRVYPDANFLPTYFSIGFFNTQGQMVYPKTIFMGLEASIRTDETDYSEFPKNYSWLVDDPSTIKDLGYLVVHENLHTLQKIKSNENSILDQAITEGAAVFLTEYFCGKESLVGIAGIDRDMISYAERNGVDIWKDFGMDLKKPESFSKWFWSNDSKYPYSMGYYMGYLICKSFYKNQEDKENAIEKLIEIKDPKFIFEHSDFSKYAK